MPDALAAVMLHIPKMFSRNSSPEDEPLYETVAHEIASGQLRAGLWARCMTDAGFDEKRAKTNYVKERVEELKHEAAAHEIARLRESAQIKAQEAAAMIQQLKERELQLGPVLKRCNRLLGLCIISGVVVACLVFAIRGSGIEAVAILGTLTGGLVGFLAGGIGNIFISGHKAAIDELARIQSERDTAQTLLNHAQNTLRNFSK